MCAAHTSEPAHYANDDAQSDAQANTSAYTTKLVHEINIGLDELKLNNGQRKTYIMKSLTLRYAPELNILKREQLQILLNNIETDLR